MIDLLVSIVYFVILCFVIITGIALIFICQVAVLVIMDWIKKIKGANNG